MRIAYLDVFAGISGDMTLGALVNAGVSVDALRTELEKIPMRGWTLRAEKAVRHGIAGTLVHVELADQHHHHEGTHQEGHQDHRHGRSCRELVNLIEASSLDPEVIARSTEILWRIARAEAKIHNCAPEDVHFHEVGGLDTIVDIVGAVVGFRMLGVEQIACSPLPVSHGFVDCAHGRLPVPAPATAELMVGAPTFPLDVDGETVTPTGAALATGLADRMGAFPPMCVQAIGYGCGQKDFPGVPNVLRLFVGERSDLMPGIEGGEGTWERPVTDRIALLEANIDDMNPELFGHVMQKLFEAGAADVWMSPVFMKKNRPATQLSAVAEPGKLEAVAKTILQETTSFGVRISEWERRCLPRKRVTVQTPFGEVRVKLGTIGTEIVQASPEYEDCLAAAKAHGVALKEVYAAAMAAARAL
jgi:uncharacterized protein (TIGR00299 family) protein